MLKIKRGINQQDYNIVDFHLVKSDYFHPLKVVDRVRDTQLQVGKNSN